MKNNFKTNTLVIVFFLVFNSHSLFSQDTNDNKVITFSKGTWHTGLTLSINNSNDENIENILINVIDNENNGFEINMLGGYFFKDDMSAGLQYSYSHLERDLKYQNEGEQSRYQSAKSNHFFTAFIRNYFPISSSNRFNFFNQTNLGFGFGNSNIRQTKSINDITKTFTNDFNLRLGVKPSIAVILTKGFAFEIAVDLLGLTYSNSNVTKDGIIEGSSSDFKFDFDISLLSLDFGLAYYF